VDPAMATDKQLMRRTKKQLVHALLLSQHALELSPVVTVKEAIGSDAKAKWARARSLALDTINFGEQQ
jgi:hypothetical protein